jgi:hypothetical protein
VYGLRAQKYGMLLKREIDKDWRNPPVEKAW